MRAGRRLQVLLVAALWCGAACDDPGAAEQASASEAHAPRRVRLVPVSQRELARTLPVTGTLAADEQVTLSAKVAGRLEAVSVDLGSRVEQGQVVAQLETRDYRLRVEQAASLLAQARARVGLDVAGHDARVEVDQTSLVRQARATLEEATANLERARRLVEQRLIARAEFDTAHATYVRAESALENAREEINHRLALLAQRRSELELAKQELADTTLKAAISGTVQTRHVSVGEYVGVGSPIATLVRLDPLRLRAEIPEREAGKVQVGQLVQVMVDGLPSRVAGRVVRLAPGLLEQSRTLVMEAEIKNPGVLRPGSFVRAEVVHEGSTLALGVPPEAIVVFAGVEKVFVVDGGRAVERRVVTGKRGTDFVEVLSGVSASDYVVAEPGNLQQGEAVSVAER